MAKAETAIVRACLDALTASGFWTWRLNSGTMVKGSRVFRGSPNGTPDIIVVLPGSRVGFIEVKTTNGDKEDSQVEWHARAAKEGVFHGLARTAKEALLLALNWRMEANASDLKLAR